MAVSALLLFRVRGLVAFTGFDLSVCIFGLSLFVGLLILVLFCIVSWMF